MLASLTLACCVLWANRGVSEEFRVRPVFKFFHANKNDLQTYLNVTPFIGRENIIVLGKAIQKYAALSLLKQFNVLVAEEPSSCVGCDSGRNSCCSLDIVSFFNREVRWL